VSRAILRQFCDEQHQLEVFDLARGRVRRTGPGGVCYDMQIRPSDPVAFEAVWRQVENRRLRFALLQILMHESDGHAALADGGSNALHRA
jgi:hypothetical protein